MRQTRTWWTTLALALTMSAPTTGHSQDTTDTTVDIGSGVVRFAAARLNQRVAGGSSWHLATEALRSAGGEFVPEELGSDAPCSGDRVWGTLIKRLSRSDSELTDSTPAAVSQPGDILQFGDAVVNSSHFPEHFTAVVATVNGDGLPSAIYYQGWEGNRKVQHNTINVNLLTSGWIRVYRPVARVDRLNEWKFTVVNNDTVDQTYEVLVGLDSEGVFTPTAGNSRGSFTIHWVKTDGTVPNILSSAGGSYFMETTKAYEIYNSNGVGIRQLTD